MTKDILSRTLLCPNCRPHARRTEASKPAAMIVPNTCWMMVIMMKMVLLVSNGIIIMKVVIMMLLLMMMAMKVTNDGGDDHDAHNDRYCDDDDDGNDDNDICFIQSNMTYINVITSLICPIVEEPFLYLLEIHFNVFLDFTTRSSATDAG